MVTPGVIRASPYLSNSTCSVELFDDEDILANKVNPGTAYVGSILQIN